MTFQSKLNESLEFHGDKTAIEYGQKKISYSTLLNMANKITAFFLSRKIEKETVIGILLTDRSDIICSIIGIINARCVFVPLDDTLPDQRLASMIKNLNLQYVILSRSSSQNARIDKWGKLKTYFLEDILASTDENLAAMQYSEYSGDDSLYVYFTSGTSGTPKGVVGKNRSLLQFILWEIETFRIDASYRVSQFISPYFDAFLRDVFVPLFTGATICIPPVEDDFFTSEKTVLWIDRSSISLIHCVPNLFRVFNSDSLTSESFRNLKYVLLSGERIAPLELVKWYNVFDSRIQLVNLYGATETTMIRSFYIISPSDAKLAKIPIGSPIRDTELLIAKRDFKACNTLVPGDLYIISAYVTKGYLNDPELTHERFLKIDSGTPNEKIAFKTGDKARALVGGKIDLIGREDRQIKLRGIRIELDEIEAIIVRSNLVKNAVVIAHKDENQNEFLLAFVIGKGELQERLNLNRSLEEYLKNSLPKYMMPSDIIHVSEYPLLSNGKINYADLLNQLTLEKTIIPPSNQTEEKILSIWKQILGDKPISVEDSFHKIGGNSLTIMNLIGRINKAYNVRISLSELFQNPTIKKQAKFIESAKKNYFNFIPKADIADYYVLSSAQKRLYFLYEFDKSSLAYNGGIVTTLQGELSKELIQSLFQQLISGHESLRTSFELVNGDPVQKIAEEVNFEVEYFDSCKEDAQVIIKEFVRPFDLSTPPLIRAGLIHTSLNEHVLIVDMHHIISDGVSQEILIRDFMTIYNGRQLPELKLNYKDFAVWQQGKEQQRRIASQKDFWLGNFSEEVEPLDLPTDFTRPTLKSYEGNSISFEISKEDIIKLRSIAEAEGASMFMVMLSIYNVLLAKLSNQEDIVLGIPIAGRHHPDLENIIGMFVNTLPIRNYPKRNLSFKAFLSLVKTKTLSCLDNQDYPYEELIDNLNVERDVSRNPLFDIMFVYQNYKDAEFEIPDITLTPFIKAHTISKFDITLFVFDKQGTITLNFEYATKLFKKETIERFIDCFKKIVSTITADINTAIGDIETISVKERELLYEFNDTQLALDSKQTINSSFEEIVLQHGEATAIVFEGETLSYNELNARCNQLARTILNRTSQTEEVIGIMMHRSKELIASIMGVLKLGCAFVPIDPQYPIDRIKYIVNDSKLSIILTEPSLQEICDQLPKNIMLIDVTAEELTSEMTENLICDFSAFNVAYLIYTSGSTGNPKGCLIDHYSLVNYVNWANDYYFSDEGEGNFSLHSSLSFYFTLTSIFCSLLRGKTLYIFPESMPMNEVLLNSFALSNNVDTIKLTPSHIDSLKYLDITSTNITKVIVGGESLFQRHIDILFGLNENLSIYNEYGPTESTVGCVVKKISKDDSQILIGKPISNTQIYILGVESEMLPIGVVGEICISGLGLSRGYLNQVELTANKFVNHPYLEGERMYKTGDLARWLPDGNIEFIGRKDDQVKVRGYRIELGEIESQLAIYPEIEETVVLAKGKEENKYLVAYYVSKEEIAATKLREFLLNQLPTYMVPAYYIRLDRLPLTSNGKLNKKALPDPELKAGNDYVAPCTKEEMLLVDLWSENLRVNKDVISVESSFFELGGHSILIIKLISQIQGLFGIHLSLPDFFKNPTIKALSKKIKECTEENVVLPDILIDEVNRHEPFPLTAVQHAYWIGRKDLFDFGNVGTHAYSESYLHELDIERLNRVIQILIQRHEMLRMVVTRGGEQRILKEVPLYEVQVLDLRKYSEKEGEKLFYKQRDELSHQVFSGEEWPLFDIRATIFMDGTFKVHYSMDALAMDAGSSFILFEEFAKLYSDPEAKLPSIKVSFRDYVLSEMKLRETKLYEKSRQYWLDRIDDIPLAPELPLQAGESIRVKSNFERRSSNLAKEKWSKLQNKAKKLGITETVLLIGCFSEVLKCWSKSAHFTLNLTLFNRISFHKDVDKLLGDFTSLTLLEIDFREEKAFLERLKEIQGRMWQDLEHKHFSGVEVQREMSKHHGSTVIMPVVLTSTLGLTRNNDNEVYRHDELPIDEKKKDFSITQTPQVWLDFQIGENKTDIWFNWDSIEGLFPERMLDNMFASYQNLLRLLADDDKLFESKNLVFLPESQRKVRTETNSTSGPVSDKLLHELFKEQVIKRNGSIAVETTWKSLTYGELYRLSNNIGHALRDQGAAPNKLVGIVMDKCWEQVAGCLGILMSGAAYLPIDADLPQERITFLLEQAEVDILLTTPDAAKRVQFSHDKKVVLVTESFLDNEKSLELETIQHPEDLAYVIFTSGSTGTPKGVMIDHRGAVNTVLDINERFNVTGRDKVFCISSLSFDLSVYDIFGILAEGGTIVIPGKEELKSPDRWLHYVSKYNITIWNSVPALMQMFVEYAQAQRKNVPLRLALLSGDWIPVDLPDKIKQLSPGVDVISLGGATEASIWSIYYPIHDISSKWKSIPYGKPLKNQSFYVLKPDLSQCPDHVPGDLYIAGIGLAKGYWRDEEKTNARFIRHPATAERLYKTGDLGRYLSDGNIEFLGREDSQVKVQGYRIELGEIESAIVQNEYIKEAVVIATGGGGNARELVAYIVPNKNVMPSTEKEIDGDNVGPLGNTGSTIQNTRERVIFKLERHGIRKFEETLASIKLRRPKQDEKLTINYQNNGPRRFTNKKMKLEEFSSVFDSLMAKQIEELPLPKYYYPSAGSLYPVQTYVCVEPGMIDEIEAGYYYYNPQEHCLELLNTYNGIGKRAITNDRVNQHSFTLHLISDLNAIRPMYGELSEIFSHQEAGYIANLLLTSCRHEIGLDSNIAINEDELSICFNLSSAHLHLRSFTGGITTNIKGKGAINIPFNIKRIKGKIVVPLTYEENKENEAVQISCIARKSYRVFNGEELITTKKLSVLLDIIVKASSNISSQKLLNIYLYVKENKIIGLEKGAYYFDPYKRVLKMINNADDPKSIFNGNESIYNSSGFAIILTGKKGKKEERNLALYLTGYIGQSIMNVSTYHNVGLCAIGSVTHKRSTEILKLSEDEEVLHTFLGGSIKLEQIESVEELSGPHSTQYDSVGLLRRYLEEKIPRYMIPSHFVFLENLPLTSNGKLNRKALPDPEFKAKEDYIEPSTETEERLAKIWSEVLNVDKGIISVNSSFFELGGHSLKATALINKINLEFGIEMLLKEVFVNETLKEQAGLIETSEWLFNKKSNFKNSEKFEITI